MTTAQQQNGTILIKLGSNLVVDAAARTILVPAQALADGIEVVSSFRDLEGRTSTHKINFKSATVETRFDEPAKLAELPLLAGSSPATITHDAPGGFARIAASGGRIHTAWSKAIGDGRYRALVRFGSGEEAASLDRRFGIAGRVRREGAGNFFGVRLEVYATDKGEKKLQLREYTGTGGTTSVLATVDVAFAFDVWLWLELDLSGAAVKGRIYREADRAPDWQVAASTRQLAGGAFGPHLFPANAARSYDIRRIEVIAPA